jgi:O-antigen/teichoic acid export membrane protein
MWQGLKVVPILLIANMCLGVYYNLSIWYKLSQSTRAGATITLIGAVLTLIINFCFIPRFGYMACAWATLICYGSMMLISFFWGQKVYPVPYNVKKLIALFCLMLLFYGVDCLVSMLTPIIWLRFLAGTVLFAAYLRFIIKIEIKELRAIPALGRFLKKV